MRLLWRLVYPLLIYNGISLVCYLLPGPEDRLLRQGIAAAAALLALVPVYRRMRRRNAPPAGTAGERPPLPVFPAAGAAASLFLNGLIAVTGLGRLLTGYEEVSEVIYSSPLAVQLLASGAVIPVTEELIFRGLCYGALREQYSVSASALVSAFLFGAFHGNLLQFLYAFLLGLLLVWCLEEAGGSLKAPVLAHGAANAASVLLQYAMRYARAQKVLGSLPFLLSETAAAGVCLWAVMRKYGTGRGPRRR